MFELLCFVWFCCVVVCVLGGFELEGVVVCVFIYFIGCCAGFFCDL